MVDTGLFARVVGERAVIDRDINSKPLVDALLQAGVPGGQIVLAYAGETRALKTRGSQAATRVSSDGAGVGRNAG